MIIVPHTTNTLPASPQFLTVPQLWRRGVLNSKDFVIKHVETIYLEMQKLDQNWADHAVAFACWDMIMNQWSKVFYLWFGIVWFGIG